MKALTQEQFDFFRENGFLFPIPALNESETKTCLDGLARLEAELGCPVADADPKWRSHAHFHSPWFNDLVRHPKILDAIEDVIGPDIWSGPRHSSSRTPVRRPMPPGTRTAAISASSRKFPACAWTALTDATPARPAAWLGRSCVAARSRISIRRGGRRTA